MNRQNRASRPFAFVLLLVYFALALLYLDSMPVVHEDEPWIASTGWSMAQRGVFGSPMFEGMDGMGEHYYEFLPLYPLVQAVLFLGAGVGLVQARFVSVAAGALTLCLTFAVGRRLFGDAVGVVAMGVLLFARVGIGTDYLPTGLLFLDTNRLARYDALVPVLGLAALALFLKARTYPPRRLLFVVGFLAGLSALAHLYGIFWGAALVLLALTLPQKFSSMGLVLAGLALPWLIYAVYVLTGLDAWLAQQHWNAARFDFSDGAWYVQNILTESNRYALPALQSNALAHWDALLFYAASILLSVILLWRALRLRDASAQALLVTTISLIGGLTIFVNSKVPNYLVTVLPLLALICAWGIVSLWNLGGQSHYALVLRPALVILGAVLLLTTILHTGTVYAQAARVAPYSQIVAALRGPLTPATRVLGLHSSWFAYADTNYRNILALFDRAQHLQSFKNPVGRAMTEFDPQVIVIDPRFKNYLEQAANDPRPSQITAWMRAQNFRCVRSVGENTQGYYRVYERAPKTIPNAFDEPCALQLTAFPVSASP